MTRIAPLEAPYDPDVAAQLTAMMPAGVAPIGLFLGRCANFINGELYGRVAQVSWAVQFPKELMERDAQGYPIHPEKMTQAIAACAPIDPKLTTPEAIVDAVHGNHQVAEALRPLLSPRHPSQLYEAALEGIALFAILWFVRTRFRTPNGMITGLFLIVYSVFRIIVENFREPDAPLVGMFTRGQFFSFFTIAIGVGFVVVSRRNPTYPRRLKKR